MKENRMLADFNIARLSNDNEIAVQKNHLGSQILYRSLDPSKKRRHKKFSRQKVMTFFLTLNK